MMAQVRVAALAVILATSNVVGQSSATASSTVLHTEFGDVNVQRLAALDNPWGMAYLPDGRLLITEKPGRLRTFSRGKLSEPIGGVPKVDYRAQGGLLDVEVDANFARNGMIYVSYAEAADQQPAGARDPGDPRFAAFNDTTDVTLKGGAVARGRLDGNQLRDVQVIWRQIPKMIGRGHFGGRIVSTSDGKLFITSGDRMRFDPAQDMGSNLGKTIRINSDGSIPADNPFVGKSGALPDIYSLGHRNLLGAAINPATKQLWIHEMGPAGGDEVNVITPGKNYGWPVVSNGDNYDGSQIPDNIRRQEFERPAQAWNPSVSPSGFAFYTANRFAPWRGNILAGGLSSMALIRMATRGNKVTGVEMIDMGKRIRDVIQSPDGSVMLLVDGPQGELLRLTPAPEHGGIAWRSPR